MKHLFIGLTLTISFISGCQSSKIEEVENDHGNFTNLEGLENFVGDVKSGKKSTINYIEYGIEGQRGVDELSYNGKYLNVSRSVDKEFIEDYQCEGIEKQINASETIYTLKQCDSLGDVNLVTVRNSK